MATKSKIEWLDGGSTWNPIIGCGKVSAGCQNCYAEQMAARQTRIRQGCEYENVITDGSRWNGETHFIPERLEQPFHWRKPRRIFPCSMGDLFHNTVTDEQIAAVFGVMAATPQHQYIVLTKRLQRAVDWFKWVGRMGDAKAWLLCRVKMMYIMEPPNDRFGPTTNTPWPLPSVTICASVEDQRSANERVPLLLQIPAEHRGVSVEPMLESVDMTQAMYGTSPVGMNCFGYTDGVGKEAFIDLIICGAETGKGKRLFKDEWALDLRDQCRLADVPFFFKKDGDGNGTICGVEYHEWIGE